MHVFILKPYDECWRTVCPNDADLVRYYFIEDEGYNDYELERFFPVGWCRSCYDNCEFAHREIESILGADTVSPVPFRYESEEW